jgi:type IV pilus assembly protein PilA
MRKQKGFSLIELLIVVAIILIIAAIAIPSLIRSKIAANHSAAVSTVRTLNTAEVTYVTYYPGTGYAATIATLGPGGAVCGAPNAINACIIDATLGCAGPSCMKGAYFYQATGGAPVGVPPVIPDYTISAIPTGTSSGQFDYCSIPDLTVRAKPDPTAVGPAVTTVATCNVAAYIPLQN